MHSAVYSVVIVWMVLLLVRSIVVVLHAPGPMDRILASDFAGFVLVSLLAVYSYERRSPHYLDAALAVALLSFTVTLAASRWQGRGKVFP